VKVLKIYCGKYIENVVIGIPIVDESEIFARDKQDWAANEFKKTLYTNERNIAKILCELGVVKSISEVRRNQPKLCREVANLDFLEVKWGKRRFWILIGE
jgi:hypothetical protein